MKGDQTFFDFAFINQDACYRKLITPDELIDDMTKQALEIIFSGLAVVTRQMLHDHVGDGKFANGRNDQELVKETQSVDTTNVEAKQDFGMLDRLMKLKPKALDIVHESIIMFTRNKTGEWRDKLSEENLKKAMNFAKNSKKQQKLMYLAKKKQIQETRIAKLRESMEEKDRKEKSQAEEREKLLKQLNEYGGLWEDAEVEEKVATFLTEKEKKSALKVQLCFRQKVIGSK